MTLSLLAVQAAEAAGPEGAVRWVWLAVALPFVWIGITVTLRRLADAELPRQRNRRTVRTQEEHQRRSVEQH